MTDEEKKALFDQIPEPPEGSVFKKLRVDTITQPHPYCITPRHVAVASDHFSGRLGVDAIKAAEKQGAACEICRKNGGRVLSYEEHKTETVLYIGVPDNTVDLNTVPGLLSYLQSIKDKAEELNIPIFAFPNL